MKTPILASAISALLLFSCSSQNSEESSSSGKATLQFKTLTASSLNRTLSPQNTTTSSVPFKLTDLSGTTYQITKAQALLRHVEFDFAKEFKCDSEKTADADSACDTKKKVTLEGPFLADLMLGSLSPDPGAFEIPIGTYKRIDIRIDDAKDEMELLSEDDLLMDHSFLIEGTFQEEEKATEFALLLKFNEDLRIENETGIVIGNEATEQVQVHLQTLQWFQTIDLLACLQEEKMDFEEDQIRLIRDDNAKGACTNIEAKLKNNIKESFQLDKQKS